MKEIFKILLMLMGLINIGLSMYLSWKEMREEAFKAHTTGMLFTIWGIVL